MTAVAIWLWLGATLATIAVFLLRRAPELHWVSHLRFWRRAIERSQPRWLSRLTLPWRSLLLALAIVWLLCVLTVGNPLAAWRAFWSPRSNTRTVLVALRGNAMSHARAADELSQTLRERGSRASQHAIVSAGVDARVIHPLAIGATEFALSRPEHDQANVLAAVRLARQIGRTQIRENTLVSAESAAEVVVVGSDGRDLSSMVPSDVALIPCCASDSRNVEIVSFGARRARDVSGEIALRVHVRASEDTTLSLLVRDMRDGREVLRQRVQTGERGTVIAGSMFSRDGVDLRASVEASSAADDALLGDSEAFASVPSRRNIRIAVFGDDPYLLAALDEHPDVSVQRLDGLPALLSASVDGRVALLPRQDFPTALGDWSHTVFFVDGQVPLGEVTHIAFLHDVFTNFDPPRIQLVHGVVVSELLDSNRNTSTTTLMRVAQGAVGVALDGTRNLVFGFAPRNASIAHSGDFPLFIDAVVRYVADASARRPSEVVGATERSSQSNGDWQGNEPARTLRAAGAFVEAAREVGIYHNGVLERVVSRPLRATTSARHTSVVHVRAFHWLDLSHYAIPVALFFLLAWEWRRFQRGNA